KSRGVTLIYVSHRLPEIFNLCDVISVLRDGKHIVTTPTSQTSPDEIVRHMIGRPLEQYIPRHMSSPAAAGRDAPPVMLSVRQLSSPGKFHEVSFDLRRGEILGLAGLVGAGRSESAHAIFGLDPAAAGSVTIANRSGIPRHAADALARGVGFLPEDRKRQGL